MRVVLLGLLVSLRSWLDGVLEEPDSIGGSEGPLEGEEGIRNVKEWS